MELALKKIKQPLEKRLPVDVSQHLEIIGRTSMNQFYNRSHEVLDIVEVQGVSGLRQMTDEEIDQIVYGFSQGLRGLTRGITWVILTSENDYARQCRYYEHRLTYHVSDHIQKQWLQYLIQQLKQYIFYEERYYMIVFGKDVNDLEEAKAELRLIPNLFLKELDEEEKIDLWFRLHNLNTQHQSNRNEVVLT